MTATRTLDGQGFLTNLRTMKGSTVMRNMGYQSNAATGNLTWRTGMLSQKETFVYDLLDRLKSVKEGVAELETMAIGFEPNGNISSKTGLGTYNYHPAKVHAVEEVDYNSNLMPSNGQSISYTAFNSAECLIDTVGTDAYRLDIMYGPDEQRWKSVLKRNGTDVKTIIFAGDYEKFIDNGVTKELYYIGANDGLAAIYVKDAIQGSGMLYAHTDNLGSIVSLTDSIGVKVFQASYDAWGKQTVSINTIGFYRGYTGHEHLPEFGLINMNGRMYDSVLGRFLSPDNYVQAADFSQSFNRYSYCINNPLKYTDPSGQYFFWDDVSVMFIGGAINWAMNGFRFDSKGLGYFVSGAAAAEVTYYAGPVAGGAVLGSGNDLTNQIYNNGIENIDVGQTIFAGVMGSATAYYGGQITGFVSPYVSGLTSKIASPVIQRAVTQGITNAASGFALGTGVSLLNGNDFQTALGDGGNGALLGAGLGLMNGAISGYKYAQKHGVNPWTGESKIDVPEGYTMSPSKKGNGSLYKDPNNPHNNMRVMPGNPNSPNPAQQNPYIIYKINGIPYDVNGIPLPGANIPGAHIPVNEFNLNKMPKP